MQEIRNAYVFVSDALRLDYLPEKIKKKGGAFETVASSTISPTSFASIVSGLHPPEHRVRTFFHSIDNSISMLKIEGYNTSFYEAMIDGSMNGVLRQEAEERLAPEEIEPPFIYLEREMSTHAPYDEWTEEHFKPSKNPQTIWGDRYKEQMWDRYRGDWETLEEKYAAGAETAADRFLDRIEMLRERDLLDETLLVFTSDHGELLGEYGGESHSEPVVSELVKVPTVFVHPHEQVGAQSDRTIISHIDIAATIEDVLNEEFSWDLSGTSIFSSGPEWGYNEFHIPKNSTAKEKNVEDRNKHKTQIQSVWDKRGGHVFKDIEHVSDGPFLTSPPDYSSIASRIRHLAYVCVDHMPLVGHDFASLSELPNAIRYHARKNPTIGSPKISKKQSLSIIEKISKQESQSRKEIELSDERREQLSELGYT